MNDRTEIEPSKKVKSLRRIVKYIIECHNNKYKIVSRDWSIEECIEKFEKSLKQLESVCRNIEEKINRKETKIFFFGRISVGKSQIINAMLGKSLLVSVPSHSTSCFVHLKKSQNSDWIIKYRQSVEDCKDFKNFKTKLKELSSCHDGNNENKLNFDESVECFVVCNKENKIFKENTEIVDCPGSANKQEITKCIEKHSLDADIFVFVVMGSITDDDQIFFKFQTEHSTKPDIFILMNGCDNADGDDVSEGNNGDDDNKDSNCDDDDEDSNGDDEKQDNIKSMENIKEQCREFLRKYYDEDEDIDKRIFMISAKEMLKFRRKKKTKKKTKKQEERCKEFENFENNIANYIADITANKLHRHDKDISSLSLKVKKAFEKFSKQINNKKNDVIQKNYQEKMEALQNLRGKISKNCKNFQSVINGNLNNTMGLVNLFNLDVVNNEIENRYKNFDEQILRFAASQGDEITDFLKLVNEDHSFKYSWEDKIISLLNENNKIQAHLEKDDSSTSKTTARFLSLVPVVSIISTNYAVNRTYEVEANNEKFKQEYIADLNNKLKILNSEKMKIINENIDIIEEEIHSNIEFIESIFAEISESFTNYWKDINNCLESYNNV